MADKTNTLTLDLVPYNVLVCGKQEVRVKDCLGSVLGKLNNDPNFTGFDSSDFKYTDLEEGLPVEAFIDGKDIVFKRVSGRKHVTAKKLLTWVSENFERIESIHCEALRTKI